jgi:hypothetical protein
VQHPLSSLLAVPRNAGIALAFFLALGLGVSAQAQAQPQNRFGDWTLVNADDGSGDVIAGTINDSGKETLGYRCFLKDGRCLYVLIAGTRCESGGEYPMLINSPSGAGPVTGMCLKAEAGDQLVLTPYKAVESPIQKSTGILGIAIPMESGAFRGVRFSMRGANAAIQEAERRMSERRSRAPAGEPGRRPTTPITF